MTEFTPGPWHANQCGIYAANKCLACTGDDGNEAEGKVQLANARLIAAAPDLLAALENMAEKVRTAGEAGEFTNWQPSYDKARAAIAKARGLQATSPYLNKPLRTVEQAVRDSEGKT